MNIFKLVRQLFTVIFSGILLVIIVGFSFLLLIIPGIFFSCRLGFVPYLVVDQKTGVFGAIKGSWKMTKGHFWRIFLLGLTFLAASLVFLAVFWLIKVGTGSDMWSYGYTSDMWISELVNFVIGIPLSMYIVNTYLRLTPLHIY